MTITRIGATKKYASNWAQAFGKKNSDSKSASKSTSSSKKAEGSAKKRTSGKASV
ncbi:MAG: hypothetical protein KJ000_19405 [Pirellulaceae bacterium]|nr:hypothetical protein [Pirellulaceae bacterium]